MKEIEIYTKGYCPYCHKAKALFEQKNLPYNEIDVENDPVQFDIMCKRASRKTVPQIFIDGRHVGGCDDLMDYNQKGKL